MAITKTGVEVDTNNTFENAHVFEENGAVNSITVSGLNADTSYYVRAYVIQDGNKIYGSDVETFQTTVDVVDYFYVENDDDNKVFLFPSAHRRRTIPACRTLLSILRFAVPANIR